MRPLFWAILGVVGLGVASWCLFVAMMTAALAGGPTTPEQLAALKISSDRLLAMSAAGGGLAVLAWIGLILPCLRSEGRSSASPPAASRTRE